MSGELPAALRRAVAIAIDDTEYERFGLKLEAIMAVIEKHTEEIEFDCDYPAQVWRRGTWEQIEPGFGFKARALIEVES